MKNFAAHAIHMEGHMLPSEYEWKLTWVDANGRRSESKHPSKVSALDQAISLERQKNSLIGLEGPNEKIDTSALKILMRMRY